MPAARPALVALASSLALVGCSDQGTSTDADLPTSSGGTSTAAAVARPALHADCGPFDDPAVLARVAEASLLDAMREDVRLEGFVAALTGELDPEVDLSGALAGGPFTVFAPVGASFGDEAATTSFLLSYHLVPGEGLRPEQLVARGSQEQGLATLQGWALSVHGDPSAPQVSEDSAAVLCGGVPTAGGMLYVIDQAVHPAGDYAVPGSTVPAVPTSGAPSR